MESFWKMWVPEGVGEGTKCRLHEVGIAEVRF